MTTSSANNSVFRGFFEKQKLTGPNFIDWYRQLRIVLSIKDKLNYLEQPLPPAPVAPAGQHVALEILVAHTAWVKGSKEIVGLMLMTIKPEIQRNLENLHANDMLKELKTLFAQQAEQELLQTTRDFHSCKQEEGHSVSSDTRRRDCPQYDSRVAKKEKERNSGWWCYQDNFIIEHILSLTDHGSMTLVVEVENQLEKTIKSLRSDRRGEYISQEFLDHLKEHGIIAHRTPPYTSQHNGVSERRNQTLLDMVRSMMSQTTLPKSF
ncbi:zinc finger, CCHC-type containing protein [Tanacetum coccineum]